MQGEVACALPFWVLIIVSTSTCVLVISIGQCHIQDQPPQHLACETTHDSCTTTAFPPCPPPTPTQLIICHEHLKQSLLPWNEMLSPSSKWAYTVTSFFVHRLMNDHTRCHEKLSQASKWSYTVVAVGGGRGHQIKAHQLATLLVYSGMKS